MTDEEPLRCSFCNLTFKRATSLAAHIDVTHKRLRVYSCSACSYEANSISLFKQHIRKHPNPEELLQTALATAPNYCSICNRYFRENHALTEHMALFHNNTKPYSCEECGSEFSSLFSYKLHMAHHLTLHCDKCDAQFRRPCELRAHIRDVHRKQDPGGTCETCGAHFKRERDLATHLKIHSAPLAQRRRFHCPVEGCKSAFTQKKNLTAHWDAVHANAHKYTCDICGKTFAYACMLSRHKRSHAKEDEPIFMGNSANHGLWGERDPELWEF
jgi:predicted nucleic acid-binding Zn ribbon protein